VTDPVTLPDDISSSSLDELAAFESQAVAAFDAIIALDDSEYTDTHISDLERLSGDVQRIRTERTARLAAAENRRARATAAAALMTPAEPDPDPVVEEPVVTAAAPVPAETVTASAVEIIEPVVVPTPPARSQVPSVRQVVRQAQALPVVRGDEIGYSLVASADVPGYAAGQSLDMGNVADAFLNRMRAFPRPNASTPHNIFNRYGVATIHKEFDPALVASGNNDWDLIQKAGDEKRLPGGSLIAAGGWCAPSETFYDFCGGESLDGLVDLPTVPVNRGGMRFTKGPQFGDVFTDIGFCQTEAQAIAGEEKDCYEIECPPFEEVRLDACGICIRAPLLTNAAYPELVQRTISLALVAHQHKMSARLLAQMATAAGAPKVVTGGAGQAIDTLAALEWSAESQRTAYRLPFSETLEVVLPHWLIPIIRADIALRQGAQTVAVSDADIQAAFASRNLRVQWVYNWQALAGTGTPPDVSYCYAAIPATVTALIYPAGTFVQGTADVITLDAVYDTASLQQNMYTALFVEEGVLLAERCFGACAVNVPVCASGKTGGALAACLALGAA
jgi:hypothetical protein